MLSREVLRLILRGATHVRSKPQLWFDNQAEEFSNFYVSIFPLKVANAVAWEGGPTGGSVITVEFELQGQTRRLNGGPRFKFTEAVSFVVSCEDQEEVDFYWPSSRRWVESQCGWLKDQLACPGKCAESPTVGAILIGNRPAMKALLGMKKLIIADLQHAAEG